MKMGKSIGKFEAELEKKSRLWIYVQKVRSSKTRVSLKSYNMIYIDLRQTDIVDFVYVIEDFEDMPDTPETMFTEHKYIK